MKSFPRFLLIVILSYVGGLYTPWWWIVAVAAFLVAILIPLPPLRSFLNAFIAVFLLWLAITFFVDVQNDHILANRMSELILKTRHPIVIGIISALIGGITAGLGGLSGSYLRYKKK